MSAHSIHHLGFLARSMGRGPEDVGQLLREWRAAERGLAELDPASDAWALLKAEIERLRQRYQEAFNAMTDSGPTESSA